MPAQVRPWIVCEGLEPGAIDRVVADDADVGAGGLQRLDEVEGEAVVVVDDQDHVVASAGSRGVSGTPAACSMARRRAAALCSVSSNSDSGTEPATMPAPVWTWA